MLKISTKGRYGLRTLMDIAVYQDSGPVTLHEISKRQGVSEKYLWQIVSPLKTAGILHMTRGKKGGCTLAKRPENINLLDLVTVLEGTLSIVDCVEDTTCCARAGRCVTRSVWQDVNDALKTALKRVTLAEILRRYRVAAAVPNYVI